MKYAVKFPTKSLEDKFYKTLFKIHRNIQDEIMDVTAGLANGPYPYGKKIFKKLTPPIKLTQYTAQYRLRVGDYRILYDVDEARKTAWVLVLHRRSEDTYK